MVGRRACDRLLDPVQPPHRTVAVRKQQERQVVALGEPPVRPHRIGAHANHLCVLGAELLIAVAKRARLDRTARRLVLRIEVKHDILPADEVVQPHGRTGLIG